MGKKYHPKERFTEDAPPPAPHRPRFNDFVETMHAVLHAWGSFEPFKPYKRRPQEPTCGDSSPTVIQMPRRTVMIWDQIYEIHAEPGEHLYRDARAAVAQRSDAAWREYVEAERAAIETTPTCATRYILLKRTRTYSLRFMLFFAFVASFVSAIFTKWVW